MVEIYSNPWYQVALFWVFIGMITLGQWPKSKANWLVQYVVATLLILSWPILLALSRRR